MKKAIKILISCEFVIFRKALSLLIENNPHLTIVGEASDIKEIRKKVVQTNPDIIVMHKSAKSISINTLCKSIYTAFPSIPILLFLDELVEISIPETIVNGVRGIIWQNNSNDDLHEAINKLANGGLYFENPDNCKMNCKFSHKINSSECGVKAYKELSSREYEVYKMIVEGYSYKEVAEKLFISSRTVETHKTHIIQKLKLKNKNELVKYALMNNLF